MMPEIQDAIEISIREAAASVPCSHMSGAVERYLSNGIAPGGFLMAVLQNNLALAASCADEMNSKALAEWGKWVLTHLPALSWGSARAVDRWMAHQGYNGMSADDLGVYSL